MAGNEKPQRHVLITIEGIYSDEEAHNAKSRLERELGNEILPWWYYHISTEVEHTSMGWRLRSLWGDDDYNRHMAGAE